MSSQRTTKNYRETMMTHCNCVNKKKEIETTNKGQEEMKNTISELKSTVQGIKSRLDEAEDWISELENKVEKNTQEEQEEEKELRKNEELLRELQDNVKCNNIHIIGIPEGEEDDQGIENLFETITMEIFPNFMREKVTQIQETQRVSTKRNPKRPISRHIITRMAKFKDKERILKVAREKQEVTYKGAWITLAADFSMETLQPEGIGKEYFK